MDGNKNGPDWGTVIALQGKIFASFLLRMAASRTYFRLIPVGTHCVPIQWALNLENLADGQ